MKSNSSYILFICLSLIYFSSCTSAVRYAEPKPNYMSDLKNTLTKKDSESSDNLIISGQASYYADKFDGRKTASGEIFRQNKYTAAHKTLPFGTKVKVTNIQNGKSVIVVINDRGPFVSGRVIDLSRAAAEDIDMIKSGVVDVEIQILN